MSVRRGKAIGLALVAVLVAFLIGNAGDPPAETTGALELSTAPGDLWLPPPEPREPSAVESWKQAGSIEFSDTGEPAWTVPQDPDWTEDPFHNDAWLFRYHSLQWLQAVALADQAAGDTSYERTRFLLFDWIRDNPRKDPPSHRSWYDHAVATRTDVMVWLYREHLAGVLSPSEEERLSQSLVQHGQVLRSYLDAERFVAHNHNMFHAMSLYNLTAMFPKIDPTGEWRHRARARISELMTEMVDVHEGVSTEQSAVYHSLALRLFTRAHRLLQTWDDDGLSAGELDTLRKMMKFGLMVTMPDGTLPAVGDTRYAQRQNLGIYRSALELVDDPVARYLLSGGSEGQPPPEFASYPNTGWTIFRPHREGSTDPALDLVMRSGPAPRIASHGHADHLSFTLFADGVPWLIDSGGPYDRDDPLREYFLSPEAHNSVIVDGHDDAHASTPTTSGDDRHLSYARGTRELSDGLLHERSIVVIKPDTVVILDRLVGVAEDGEQATTLYHLGPGSSLTPVEGGAGQYVARSDGRELGVWLDASEPIDVQFSALGKAPGVRDARVTRGLRLEERSPLLSVRHRVEPGDWSIAVLQPGREDAGAINARLAGDAVVVARRGEWRLEIPLDAQLPPTLRRP